MFDKEAEDYARSKKIKDDCIRFYDTKKHFKDGAELGYNKCKEEMQKNGLALQSDMDKTIEQNVALKEENAELKEFINAPHTKGRKTTRGDYIKTVWDLSKQLAEAKDLLKKLYKETRGYMNDQGFDMNVINEVYAFINSEVEK